MINLQKGQNISLTKESSGLTNVLVGLGWDKVQKPAKKMFSLFSKKPEDFDLDASVLLLHQGDKLTDIKKDVVYFGNKTHFSGAVVHRGDNLTGEGKGDDERITVNLKSLPTEYQKLVFMVNIYKAKERNQNFGMVDNAFIRIVDSSTNKELCRYSISNDVNYSDKTAMIFGELYRHNDEWKFSAIGNGLNTGTISEVANIYR